MNRRVDDISGRGEAVSGIVSAGGVAGGLTQGGQGVTGGPGGVGGGPGGYVRGPTITHLGTRPGQPTTPVATAGTPVPGVVPVPATTVGQGVGGAPTPLDHQPHNPASQPGKDIHIRLGAAGVPTPSIFMCVFLFFVNFIMQD